MNTPSIAAGATAALNSPGKYNESSSALSRNIAASLTRVAVNALIALLLPAYLTHRLPVSSFASWVLVLQLSAYVSFLDFGAQIGVAKFVAEYDARGDRMGASQRASAGFLIMILAGVLGVAITAVLAWQLPRLFQTMPASLYQDVRTSVILVGTSLSFGLVCSVFAAVFIGLQRYTVPTVVAILNRALSATIVVAAVSLHGSLVVMACAVAIANISAGILQIALWKKLAPQVSISLRLVDRVIANQVFRYCIVLAVWSGAMLCISGLDLTIVGHYDFKQTGYYSIATLPNNFMLMILSAALGPLLPAASALSAQKTSGDMGNLLLRATRYGTICLLLSGLVLFVFGYPLLRIWVGADYAANAMPLLRVLILANIVRNVCSPYATMVVAVGKQGAATASALSEAIVNVGSSIFLAVHFGALGVAYGTLLGAAVGVGMHFAISMRRTHSLLSVARRELFRAMLLRPALISLPALALFLLRSSAEKHTSTIWMNASCLLATIVLAWFIGLTFEERSRLTQALRWHVLSVIKTRRHSAS